MIQIPTLPVRLCGALLSLATAACTAAAPAAVPSSDPAAQPATRPAVPSHPSPERPNPADTPDPTCERRRKAPARWVRRLDRVIGIQAVGVAVGARGRLLYGHNARRPRVPASNQKLPLSMALLDTGSDFRIPTRAAAERVAGSLVKGDLWIIGAGDPTLSAASPGYWGGVRATTLEELAAEISRAGITEVRGSVVGARGYFAHDMNARGWQPYVPGRFVQLPSALVVDGNNSGAPDPEGAAAAALTRALRRHDVRVMGPPGSGRPPANMTNVGKVQSRPLDEILAYMNRTSNNFFAEVLGKLLGAKTYGPPGTIAKGARSISAWADAHGASARAHDGSGLSYSNRISPRDLVRLLAVVQRKPWGKDLRRGLPGAGEGTLRSRLHGLEVRAKTGTLFNGASTLSGWVRSQKDGRWISFSILGRSTPKTLEDRIVGIVSRFRVPVAASKC